MSPRGTRGQLGAPPAALKIKPGKSQRAERACPSQLSASPHFHLFRSDLFPSYFVDKNQLAPCCLSFRPTGASAPSQEATNGCLGAPSGLSFLIRTVCHPCSCPEGAGRGSFLSHSKLTPPPLSFQVNQESTSLVLSITSGVATSCRYIRSSFSVTLHRATAVVARRNLAPTAPQYFGHFLSSSLLLSYCFVPLQLYSVFDSPFCSS